MVLYENAQVLHENFGASGPSSFNNKIIVGAYEEKRLDLDTKQSGIIMRGAEMWFDLYRKQEINKVLLYRYHKK